MPLGCHAEVKRVVEEDSGRRQMPVARRVK